MKTPLGFLSSQFYTTALFLSLSYAVVMANPVHVAVNGEDSNPGTESAPVATVRKALQLVWDQAEPSEIVVHEGVYSGDVAVGDNTDRLGGARPHLLIRAAQKPDGSFEEVIFDGGRKIETAKSVPGMTGVFKVPGKHSYHYRTHLWETDTRIRYTLVADLAAVEHYPSSFWHSKSEVFFHTSDDQPPEVHDMGISQQSNGITLWRPKVTVRGLQFRNFLSWRWSCGVELRGANTAAEDCRVWNSIRGFQIMMEPEGTRVTRCRADDCGGGVYSQGVRAVIEDCRLYKIRDRFMVPCYPQDDTGIQFYHPAAEGEVRRNLCVGFCNGIFVKCKNSEFIVEHNTCVDGITFGMGCTSWHLNSIFQYNILVGFSYPILGYDKLKSTNVVDWNCIWDSRSDDALQQFLDGPRETGTGKHSIIADPRFAGPAVADYRLLPDSPCSKMGPTGETCGALAIVPPDFESVQPPRVEALSVSPVSPPTSEPEVLGLIREPFLYTSVNGTVISFETDTPCHAKVEFGDDRKSGTVFNLPPHTQRSWMTDAGELRVRHTAVLLPPLVESGRTYHYRLILFDEQGNSTVTGDGTFTLKGEPKLYFISPKGRDADGGGSHEEPWRTIQFAVDRALPGDRIILRSGLYPGETILTHGGLEDAPITLEAEKPGTAILDARREANTCLHLVNAPYVVIKGLEVRWFGVSGTFYSDNKAGIFIADSPHVSVLSCRMWNDFWMGWPIGSGIAANGSPGLVADHNIIYQVEQGIRLYRSPGARITHNTILKNMYGAVKFIYSAENSISRNNSFCFSGNDQYLVIYRDREELETFDSDYNNLGTKLRRPEPGDEIVPSDPFFQHHGSKAVISLNGERYNSLRIWQQATGKDRQSIFKEPRYVDPENWDFRLQPDSPNISAGENGADIGALGPKR